MRQRDRAREKLGDVISTLLIIVGATGLVIYLLYMRNPNNVVLYYALTALIILGGSLAILLAILYLTRGVEPQGGTEQLRATHLGLNVAGGVFKLFLPWLPKWD